MTQRHRPTTATRTRMSGFDEPARQPLARVAPAAAPAPRQGRAYQPPVAAPAPDTPSVGGEMQLSVGMIVVSMPVAFSFGQMLIDRSLSAMPQMVGWTALVLAYKTVTAPGVARGFLDWMGDSVHLGPELRERLGVPEVLPRVAPRPHTRGVVGWVDGLGADVRNLRAAVAARRGELVEDTPTGLAAGRAGWADADNTDEPPDEPDIGLPVVRLEEIANLDNLWVVGPKGSGKTTVLRQLLELRRGKHWAIDPHATPGKWPDCTVVGGGRDFAAIDHQIDTFIGWMDGRYKNMGTGRITEAECKAARRTLVGDEWRAIRKNLPGAKDMPSAAARLLDILSEGRKAGICALAASHLDTAEGMGISGEKDMLKCFDMVLYLGAMATKCVPTAARMARPAVVYDPEHDVWAQLIIALPTTPAGDVLGDEEEDAPVAPTPTAAPAPTPSRQRQAVVAAAPTRPAPAPLDDMLTGLLAGIAAPAPAPAPDLSAVSPARAARLAAIMERQGAAPVAVAAPVAAPRAPVATGSIGHRRRVDRPARATQAEEPVAPVEPSEPVAPSGAAAPSGATVPVVAPSGAAAPPGWQGLTIETPPGERINLFFQQQQVAAPAPAAPRQPRSARTVRPGRNGMTTEARRAAYIEAAQRGEEFNPTHRRIGGNRNVMLEVFNAAIPH